MTETADASTPATGADSPADEQTVPGQGNDTGEQQENGSEGRKPPREQRYRMERNEARAQIEALQLREVSRLAGEHLAQPGDLMALGGVELADLLGEDGYVDPEAVAEAAAALIVSRPGLAKNLRVAATDPTQGRGGGPLAPSEPKEFSGMFGP